MRKKLIYIFGLTTALLSSCVDEGIMTGDFLNGKEKTPIAVVTNLQTATSVTRAVDEEFEVNENLIAYIKHVTVNAPNVNPLVYKADVSGTGVGPRLVNFQVSALTTDHKNEADNWTNHSASSTLTVTDSQGLYWDDFSNSASADTDLRTTAHALMVDYGYCYNGGAPSPALTESTGVIGWTVETNQNTEGNLKKSDLLFASRQTPVAYAHGTNNTINGRDKVLNIPYSHAMSKITVDVICSDGFNSNVDENFGNASLKITSANTKTSVTAPTATVDISTNPTPAEITMQKGTQSSDKKQCTFTAIVAPTLIKENTTTPFITLTNIDGNDYKVFLTDAVIDAKETDGTTTKTDAWSTKLAASTAISFTPSTAAGYDATNGGKTLPGVNYHLTVTLKKQTVKVNASIRDWSTVNASTEGEIDLPDGEHQISDDPAQAGQPIDVKTVDKDKFQTGASFSLFAVKHESSTDQASERINDKYEYLTVSSFVDETTPADDYWKNTPEIYWQNNEDNYYFRALATYNGLFNNGVNNVSDIEKVGTVNTNEKGTHVTQGTIADKKDIIWATTPRHIGRKTGETEDHIHDKGAAIPPRKGGVPLAFEHIMTKITFNLVDANKDATQYISHTGHPLNPKLDLTGAKIQITNLSTDGEIKIEDGSITPGTVVNGKIFGSDKGFNPAYLNGTANALTTDLLKEYVVVPQTIGDNAMVTITLNNGMTYKVQLNKCQATDAQGNPIMENDAPKYITKWERGQHYTYTITLAKEGIQFRALIKDWEEKYGGGNATLDWD